MDLKSVLLPFLCLWFSSSNAQNLGTALHMNSPEDFKSGYSVQSFTTEMTFYNRNGSIEKKKEVTALNAQQYKTSELRYDEDGTLTARYTCRYDSTGTKSLGRKLEHWHNILGYTFEVNSHEYDKNGFLIKTTEKNQNNTIVMVTHYTNDEKGNPTEIRVANGNGLSYGAEKVEYDYTNNKVTSRVYNLSGELLSEKTSTLDDNATDDPSIVKNEQGDVIQSPGYITTYTYDKKGNWVHQVNYKIEGGKQVKQSEFKRKISYGVGK